MKNKYYLNIKINFFKIIFIKKKITNIIKIISKILNEIFK